MFSRLRAVCFLLVVIICLVAFVHAKKTETKVSLKMIEPEDLKKHVTVLVSHGARSLVGNQLELSAEYIESELRATGLDISSQSYVVDEKEFRNVIATLNPELKQVVVVGAHYDTYGDQPGADDNASGVAGLIEIARALAPRAKEIPYQIQFVAFSTEEPPYFRSENMGSFQHARSLFEKKVDVKLMICLEMIGYFSDEKKSQRYPSRILNPFYPSRGNFIAVVSKFGQGKFLKGLKRSFQAAGISAEKLAAPAFLPGIDFSDHLNYWKFGYKAVMVSDTAFYRNKNYHEQTDTLETLDFERMSKVVAGVSSYLLTKEL